MRTGCYREIVDEERQNSVTKTGKWAWYGVLAIIGLVILFDVFLDGNDEQMTISQMAYDAGQRHPYIIVIVGAAFVFLFVHLFLKWKRFLKR